MKQTLTSIVPFIVALTVLLIGVLLFVGSIQVKASAPSGLPALVATSSNPTVTTSASLVFATSSCSARIITTTGALGGIMITFGDTSFGGPTGLYGHFQAASTTVTYDSGQVGCGALRIYSFASQAISVTESR